jgi:hypothetical protein
VRSTPRYPISPRLDPVIPRQKLLERKHWRFETIMKAAAKAPAIVVPDEWIHPYVTQYLRRMRKDQGGIGDCTGAAKAYGDEILDQFMLLHDFPTEADFAAIQRDALVKEDGWRCTMRFDMLPPQARSTKFAYDVGREKAWPDPKNRPPEGGTMEGVVKAGCESGSLTEELCVTAKTSACVATFYTQQINPATGQRWTEAELRAEAKKHCWEGYAIAGDSIDEIADAIFTSYVKGTGGFGLVGINLREDYQNLSEKTIAGYTVHLFPGKSGTSVGGHAQCIVGFSKSKGVLVTLASWGWLETAWPFLNGFDAGYYRDNGGPVFVPLDSSETAIGRIVFSAVVVGANVPCQFYVNDRLYTDASPKVSLPNGQPARVRAVPTDPSSVEMPPDVTAGLRVIAVSQDGTASLVPDKSMEAPGADGKPAIGVNFTFRPAAPTPPDPNPIVGLLKALWALILGIFGKK